MGKKKRIKQKRRESMPISDELIPQRAVYYGNISETSRLRAIEDLKKPGSMILDNYVLIMEDIEGTIHAIYAPLDMVDSSGLGVDAFFDRYIENMESSGKLLYS